MSWTQAQLDGLLKASSAYVLGEEPNEMVRAVVKPDNNDKTSLVKVTEHHPINRKGNRAIKVTVEIGKKILKFDSKTEYRAWLEVDQWWPGQIDRLENQIFSMYLPGRIRYTPDLLIIADNKLSFIEVKSSWKAYQSGRNSKSNLSIAAGYFAWYADFYSLVVNKDKTWLLEKIGKQSKWIK